MHVVIFIACLLLAPLSHAQSEALDAIRAQLQLPAIDTGTFVQQRELALFPQPLVSQGRFAHVRDLGLHWQVETPLQTELRILNGQAQERVAGQRWSDPLLGAQGSQVAAQLLTSLLAADLDSLQQHFIMQGNSSNGSWDLQLKPKQTAIQSMLQSATVSGADQVNQLLIAFSSGEKMLIKLNHEAEAALSPVQEQALEVSK